MAPPITRHKVRDLDVRMMRAGAGAPLLFLHSAGGLPVWTPFFDKLAAQYDVNIPEHPGFGDTGHVRVGDGDCRDRVTGDIRERLKIAGIFFSGHAMSPFNGRAGKDVMELVEQQRFPNIVKFVGWIRVG